MIVMKSLPLSYKKLLEKNKKLTLLGSVQGTMSWDMETMMPPRAVGLRSEQMALLSSIFHKSATSPEIGSLLAEVMKKGNFDMLGQIEKRNVELIKKSYDERTKIPTELVEKIAKQRAVSVNVWKKAKKKQDYSMFRPELEKNIDLSKKLAEILMKVKDAKSLYDALLDDYEPKITTDAIAKIFSKLQNELRVIISKCENSGIQVEEIKKSASIDAQKKIAGMLAEFAGYDITSDNAGGRIDETEHPFTQGYFDDVRITTHYYENNIFSSIFSTLHEMGHAIYEQNIDQKLKYQPVGSACSYGIHESQSRFLENMVGRSKEFWTFFLPNINSVTCLDLDMEKLLLYVNRVRPSKIRIEADEVTYGLHIITRFEIERDMFSGKLDACDLPNVWNSKYKEYLGLEIKNDSEGVMQDMHWASNLFGYFPSYALGNIYGGQMLGAMNKKFPNWKEDLSKGDLTKERIWIKKNIYDNCKIYDPADLIKKITGKPVSVEPFVNYLKKKFGAIYGF
ncbi:MAG: carboxypeptidase M32 [Candidatus Aenigmarchaeota archaeon]|nr:carboxypeptidase M32 [Candidatus Aenigmarchaeota archaeon]